ncbi:unnamed protein product [Dicrocoelium dendriticum]|nr:unnamed protein product [Dicrocoelium dendriticum]
MNIDIRQWAKSCIQCQKSKVHRHTITTPGTFSLPDARFKHVHLDIVGPLPPSNGFTHLLTCVDRFTRWPHAVPLRDTSAETVAHTFVESWASVFGVPATITTDRGPQFTSTLFRDLNRLMGCNHLRTTAYHPASNGLVERFHRQLKAALTASATSWYEALPIILLSIRNTSKEDIGCSPAELTFGTTLRLPGEMIVDSRITGESDPTSYVARLKHHMSQLQPTPTRRTSRIPQVHKDLHSCPFVFVRVDAVRKPLQPPYEGPFKVISRHDKYYVVDRNGTPDSVSLDRLKVAYLDDCSNSTPVFSHSSASATDPRTECTRMHPTTTTPTDSTCLPQPPTTHTRSGRTNKTPVRFRDYTQ